jgi:hypothetical protein
MYHLIFTVIIKKMFKMLDRLLNEAEERRIIQFLDKIAIEIEKKLKTAQISLNKMKLQNLVFNDD